MRICVTKTICIEFLLVLLLLSSSYFYMRNACITARCESQKCLLFRFSRFFAHIRSFDRKTASNLYTIIHCGWKFPSSKKMMWIICFEYHESVYCVHAMYQCEIRNATNCDYVGADAVDAVASVVIVVIVHFVYTWL